MACGDLSASRLGDDPNAMYYLPVEAVVLYCILYHTPHTFSSWQLSQMYRGNLAMQPSGHEYVRQSLSCCRFQQLDARL